MWGRARKKEPGAQRPEPTENRKTERISEGGGAIIRKKKRGERLESGVRSLWQGKLF